MGWLREREQYGPPAQWYGPQPQYGPPAPPPQTYYPPPIEVQRRIAELEMERRVYFDHEVRRSSRAKTWLVGMAWFGIGFVLCAIHPAVTILMWFLLAAWLGFRCIKS